MNNNFKVLIYILVLYVFDFVVLANITLLALLITMIIDKILNRKGVK